MDLSLERDSTALGSLFQQIINDMKNTSPLWEDFVAKAGKLHTCLRAAIQAIAAYLDAFQKIADAATNSRGASKEIGTALTRVCLRHKAVETRLKTFTAAIMDCLVQPLQEKIEDWKRTVATIDKEHAKEYKRCRTELKKRSSDTLRLQKKARKGQTDSIQSLMDSHMQDVTLRRAELEDVEKKSLRSAMIEERLRYCTFVHLLQPVVKEECEVMSELGHLQEAMESIAIVTKEPNVLPQASEELIHDAKATMSLYPESPSAGSGSQGGGCSNSLGSRKSSVCSISSINSSGSSNSPGHHHHPRSLSQFVTPAIRLKPGESSDSGFCSSPALTTQASTTTSQTHAVSTWPPHSQDVVDNLPPTADRPHTISTAYEKGHQRPPLTVYTFQNPETIHEAAGSGNLNVINTSGQNTPVTQKSPAGAFNRPPLPVRCSSLERPLSANSNNRNNSGNLLQRQCPSPIPAHITKELSAAHHAQQQQNQQHHQQQQQQQQQLQQLQQQQLQSPPTYVNMSELANMAALKITNQQQQQQQHHQQQPKPLMLLQQQTSIDSMSSQHSNDSIASTNTPPLQQQTQQHNIQNQQQQQQQNTQHYQTTRSHSVSSSVSSNTASSLHSHPSIESTFATPLVGQTPTTSSGSSTPQNHYSPLLTNSPSSTAAGTPSGASITSSGMTGIGFVYNVNSPTPSQSGSPSLASDVLKITESDPCTNQAQQITTPTNDEDSFPPLATTTSQETHNQTNKNSAVIDTDSPTIVENDERSRASVLQKASMFEKQAAAAASPATPNATSGPARTPIPIVDNGGIYGTHGMATRRSDEYRAPQPAVVEQQQDVGGSTRIARRASVNTAKPPPPVRRSSSVTPTPNASNTQQQHQHTNTSILVEQQQQQYTMSNSTESLPPPPPYLLDGARSTQSTPNSPPLPPTLAMPNSSLKVSETVKALAAMQHQPASPSALRRIQQNQQQQTQPQNILQLDENDYDIYFNTYDEINSSHLPQSQNLTKIHELHNGQQHYVVQQQQQDHRQLRNLHEELYVQHILPNQIDLLTLECANIPPPLPPPNPNQQQRATAAAANHSQPQTHILQQQQHAYQHYQSNHQNHHHHQQQQNIQVQQQQPIDANIYDSKPASFRTSSPGIYAQPKVVNNMSSFRTASPSPNGHAHHHHHQQQQQQQHQLPPTQPKTNPNLIAQLNARLSGKQQQHQQQHQQQPNVADSIYGNSSNMTNHEAIYMRNYGQHQQQMPSTGPQQQQQQQQQHDDYGTSTNIEKTGSIRAKTKAEFLENLNAKLAKQGMSGRAFAVRNLINSKALPDPRLCHESLMDQIKRGATLKRNQKINDRSAPKIY